MGIVLSHAAIFCHPLSKWRTMLIRRIEKKTSIDQGLKLLREAKELLSGSLSDNIVGLHMTSLKFKLKNYRSYRDFTFTMH